MRDSKSGRKRPIEGVEGVRPRKGKLESLRPTITTHKKAKGVPAAVKEGKLRKTGIDVLGEVGWGTHFCLFYHTRQDLIDILVPYFKAGLENNEFCMWVTSEPLKADDAKRSLKRAVRNLDDYIKKGQIEILDYSDWYTKTGAFEADEVLLGYVEKHDEALRKGFDGLRVSGNTLWLEKKDWKKFADYEAVINGVIGKYKMLIICTYSLEQCEASEILDVEHNHQFALIKWKGDWKILESSDRNQIEARLAEQTMIAEALEHSKKEWVNTFNAMSDWVCMMDLRGRILRTNLVGEEFTGKPLDEIIGQSCCRLVHGSEKHIPGCPLLKMCETGQRASAELQVPDTDQWMMVTTDPVTDEEGEIIGAVHITRDITERKRAEKLIRESEQRLKNYIDSIAMGISIVSPEMEILDMNEIFKEWFPKIDLKKKPKCYKSFYHPPRKEICSYCPTIKTFEDGKIHSSETDLNVDGNYYLVSAAPLKDETGRVTAVIETVQNITERKKAEEALLQYHSELKSLTPRLILAEERERRRIAVKLHDRISQSLTISKLELDELRSSVPAKGFAKKLKGVCNSLGQAIADTRSLTSDLSSPILYELGFEAAVAGWLSEQIEKKHGITTNFEDDNQPKPLDDDVRVLLFRDVRELLINVVKHAHAKKIKVSIARAGGDIEVRVEDDGCGFDAKEAVVKAVKAGGFGLFSIKGRLEELGGHLEIESEAGCGTKVTLIAPLKQEKVDIGVEK